MKLKYITGLRPTPMLMYYVKPEKTVFDEMFSSDDVMIKKGKFVEKYNHIWNMGAYIIYDENTLEIISFIITNFSNFIYLLRTVNKPLIINIDEESYNIISTDVNNIFKDEFEME